VSVRALAKPTARRRAGLIATAAAVALVALSLAVLRHAGSLFALDKSISDVARHYALAHPVWLHTMAAITVTGSTTVLGPVAAIGCLALLAFRRWRPAVLVAVALPATLLIRLIAVTSIARPRPIDQLGPSSGWSFPSGHTTASAATALIAVLVLWPLLAARWSRILMSGLFGAWAVAVGVSRVAVVVHWPSDVLGGWLLVLTVIPAIAAALMPTTGRSAVTTEASAERAEPEVVQREP
jgi:undecaprenyl-diphosphatase